MPVQRLNNAVLYVREVERSVRFYRETLGFRPLVQFPGAAFLQAPGSTNDHDLALFEEEQRPGGSFGPPHHQGPLCPRPRWLGVRGLLAGAGRLDHRRATLPRPAAASPRSRRRDRQVWQRHPGRGRSLDPISPLSPHSTEPGLSGGRCHSCVRASSKGGGEQPTELGPRLRPRTAKWMVGPR